MKKKFGNHYYFLYGEYPTKPEAEAAKRRLANIGIKFIRIEDDVMYQVFVRGTQ